MGSIRNTIRVLGLALSLTLIHRAPLHGQALQPNFIFIIVDDLNDYVQGLSDMPQLATPHMQSLADSGTLFMNSYANSPGCAPSRTSFLSGKGLAYTQVYNNEDYPSKFREVFSAETNNQVAYTIPQILKDSAGYFTYGINKIFHNPNNNDFDKTVGTPMCEKELSWNNMLFFEDSDSLLDALSAYGFGDFFDWGMIPDSLEPQLEDYIATDIAIQFLDSVAAGTANTCGDPFFLTIGYYKPHIQRYIPEQYFPPHYVEDIYAEPFDLPYNFPEGTFPYNGIVMPPQPDTIYSDYDALPDPGIARALADNGGVYDQIEDYVSTISPLPEIDPLLTDEDRRNILRLTTAANYHITYMAAVQYIDAQIGRLMNALHAHPALAENTVIVLIGDNGYSLGEKRHWTKWSLWEPDIRVPMIIVDPARPGGQVVKKTVSLIDLFPTFCDMAGVAYPVRPDGTRYLDGSSLMPLLEAPDAAYGYPALASYRKTGGIGSCYPHHSVRDERWHYIRYQQNNDGGFATSFCDSLNRSFEEELYEIGENRQTDPYEWNNLADDPDYAPVIHYLEQWMPDSVLYAQKTFGLRIDPGALDCYVDITGGIELHANITDTTGALITLPDSLTLRWTTDRSDIAWYGNDVVMDMTAFDDDIFNGDPQLMVYAELLGTDSTIIRGFDLAYIYVDAVNTPEVNFNVFNIDDLTVLITDYTATGTYYTGWWDFGDGTVSTEDLPGPHTYADPGDYEITRHVLYGNDSCEIVFTRTVTLDTNAADAGVTVFCFPNPASQMINIYVSQPAAVASVDLLDLSGRRVEGVRFLSDDDPLYLTLDVSGVTAGMYVAHIVTAEGNYAAPIVVMH